MSSHPGAARLVIVLLTLLYAVGPVAMPVLAAATHVTVADDDCCPPGSHPPGQCPRHNGKRPSPSTPRLSCPCTTPLLFVTAGATPVETGQDVVERLPLAAPARSVEAPADPAFVPASPPPKR